MNFFNQFKEQFLVIWGSLKPLQRSSIVAITAILAILLIFIVYRTTAVTYVPLFSDERMKTINFEELKTYLTSAKIPYKIKDHTILVPQHQEKKIRLEFGNYQSPKAHSEKGFELYDSNTWIKGEKELQILEMRALKSQLEQDISEFENIRSAKVILDIAPQRPLSGNQAQTKASIILTLKPAARLSPQEVRAITYHVAGAIRGLKPNMIAISDTTGKLYQAIDPDSNLNVLHNEELAFEEHLKAKIDGMLAKIVGMDNFYSSIQVIMKREKEQDEKKNSLGSIESISIGVLINDSEKSLLKQNREELQKKIQNQLTNILSAYSGNVHQAVNFLEFHQSDIQVPLLQLPPPVIAISYETSEVVAIIAVIIAFISLVWAILTIINSTRATFSKNQFSKNISHSGNEESKSLEELEEKISAIQRRLKNDSHAVLNTIQLWLKEDKKINE